jgi:signal transduction histidine kinase
VAGVLARLDRRRQLAVDAGLALGLIALSQLQVWTVGDLVGNRAAISAISLAVGLSLFFRRRHPFAVLVGVCAYFPITAAAGWNTPEVTFFPSGMLMLASYSVAAHGDRRRALAGAALVVAVAVAGIAAGDLGAQEAFFFLLFNAAAWTGGLLVHSREQQAVELVGRSEALEREAEERARVAAAEERARIARELHDVVSHGLSGIVLEAAGAERVLDRDPEAVRGALDSIQRAGREATGELRRLLGMMRTARGAGDAGPLPALTRAGELAGRARRAGIKVELRTEGDLAALPAGLQVAAYRILQEAVTNVLKHAPGTTAYMVVRRTPSSLEVGVLDEGDGRTAARAPPGHGLIGMRERVALYGGVLEAGTRQGGGFRVHAHFPLPGPVHEGRRPPEV